MIRRYDSVADLGTPEEAAAALLKRFLTEEFMSTRIGIRREGNVRERIATLFAHVILSCPFFQVLGAQSRRGSDGLQYYDIQIQMTSYSSKNPYSSTRAEVSEPAAPLKHGGLYALFEAVTDASIAAAVKTTCHTELSPFKGATCLAAALAPSEGPHSRS